MYYTICWYKVDIQGRWLWHILYRWQIIQLYWFASILLNFWSVVITFNFILFSLDKDRLHTNIYQLSLILNLYSQNTKNIIFVFRDYFLENIESTFILFLLQTIKAWVCTTPYINNSSANLFFFLFIFAFNKRRKPTNHGFWNSVMTETY